MSDWNEDGFWDSDSRSVKRGGRHQAPITNAYNNARNRVTEGWEGSETGDFPSENRANIKSWQNNWDKVKKENWGGDSSDAESSFFSDHSSWSQRIHSANGRGRGSAINFHSKVNARENFPPQSIKNQYPPDGSFNPSFVNRSRFGPPRSQQHSTGLGNQSTQNTGRGGFQSYSRDNTSYPRNSYVGNFEDEFYSDQQAQGNDNTFFDKNRETAPFDRHSSGSRGQYNGRGRNYQGTKNNPNRFVPILKSQSDDPNFEPGGFYDASENFEAYDYEGEDEFKQRKPFQSSMAYKKTVGDPYDASAEKGFQQNRSARYESWENNGTASVKKPFKKNFNGNTPPWEGSNFANRSNAGNSHGFEDSDSRGKRKNKEQMKHSNASKLSSKGIDTVSETPYDSADERYIPNADDSLSGDIVTSIDSFPVYGTTDPTSNKPNASHKQMAPLEKINLQSSNSPNLSLEDSEIEQSIPPENNTSNDYAKEQIFSDTVEEEIEQSNYYSDSDAASFYSYQDYPEHRISKSNNSEYEPAKDLKHKNHSNPSRVTPTYENSIPDVEGNSSQPTWKFVEENVLRTDQWLEEAKSEASESMLSSVSAKVNLENEIEIPGDAISKGYSSDEAEEEEDGIDSLSEDEDEEDDEDEDEEVKKKRIKCLKHMEAFLTELVSYSNPELSDNSREWKCKACVGISGEISWYPGISALVAHCNTLKKKNVKEHRYLAKSIKSILEKKGIAGSVCGGKVQGHWKGLEKVNEQEKCIVWPPMLVIRNTRLFMDSEDKWVGMGNKELVESFTSCKNIKRGRHAYGPQGHRDLSLLIFNSSPVAYHEAVALDKELSANARGRKEWERPSQPRVGQDNKKLLYGYLAEPHDIVEFNRHHKGNQVVDFKLKKMDELATELQKLQEEVVKVTKLSFKVEQLSQEKQELKMKYDMLENSASLHNEQESKLKRKNGEIEALHKITEDNKKAHEKEVISMEQHYQMKIQEMNQNFTKSLSEIQKQHHKQTEELRQQILALTQQQNQSQQQKPHSNSSQSQQMQQQQQQHPVNPSQPNATRLSSNNDRSHFIAQHTMQLSQTISLLQKPKQNYPASHNFPLGMQQVANDLHLQNILFSQGNSSILPPNALLSHPNSLPHQQTLSFQQQQQIQQQIQLNHQLGSFPILPLSQMQQRPNFTPVTHHVPLYMQQKPPGQVSQRPLKPFELYEDFELQPISNSKLELESNSKSQQEIDYDIWLPETPGKKKPSVDKFLAHQLALVEDSQRQQAEFAKNLNELQEKQHKKKMEWKKKLLEEEFEFEKQLDVERLSLLSEYAYSQALPPANPSAAIQDGETTGKTNENEEDSNLNSNVLSDENSNADDVGKKDTDVMNSSTITNEFASLSLKEDRSEEAEEEEIVLPFTNDKVQEDGHHERRGNVEAKNVDEKEEEEILQIDSFPEAIVLSSGKWTAGSEEVKETTKLTKKVNGWGYYDDDYGDDDDDDGGNNSEAIDNEVEELTASTQSYATMGMMDTPALKDDPSLSFSNKGSRVEEKTAVMSSSSNEFSLSSMSSGFVLQDSAWKREEKEEGYGVNAEDEKYWNQQFLKSFEGNDVEEDEEEENDLEIMVNEIVNDDASSIHVRDLHSKK